MQGKEGIPEDSKRLIFPIIPRPDSAARAAGGSEVAEESSLLKELQSWQAIFRLGDQAPVQLHNPKVTFGPEAGFRGGIP